MKKLKLKKNDPVVVVSGSRKDRGKVGKIMEISRDKNRVRVEGVRMMKEFVRPNPQKNIQGGVVEREGYIAVSNVMYYDSEAEQGCRIGYREENGKKVRFSKKTGRVLD